LLPFFHTPEKNLQFLLGATSPDILVSSNWDYMKVNSSPDEVLIDIQHPEDEALRPLQLAGNQIILFYKLNTAFNSD
jgi:hypothetical protein